VHSHSSKSQRPKAAPYQTQVKRKASPQIPKHSYFAWAILLYCFYRKTGIPL